MAKSHDDEGSANFGFLRDCVRRRSLVHLSACIVAAFATWTPTKHVTLNMVWAAVDCDE